MFLYRYINFNSRQVKPKVESLIHFQLAVLHHAEAVGERLVYEVINFTNLNPHQCFLLLLLFCGRFSSADAASFCLFSGAAWL